MKELKIFLLWLWGASVSATWFIPWLVPYRGDYWLLGFIVPMASTAITTGLSIQYLVDNWNVK